MYKLLIRPLLFSLPPEKAHNFSLGALRLILSIPIASHIFKSLFSFNSESLTQEFWGMTFKNPVGLAAGFDKDARHIKEMSALGFGFIEIGTLTPKGQPGNEKPRLFRLPKDHSLINRMGFNNGGVGDALGRLKNRPKNLIVGGNIGKNKLTPNENAVDDYLQCFNELYACVDYFVVNLSSPNTPGLRELQEKEPLKRLLKAVLEARTTKASKKPILLKIAPDLSHSQLDEIVQIIKELNLDGVIATNTTISREGLSTNQEKIDGIGAGGLSGRALTKRSTEVVRYIRQKAGHELVIIGVGGIFNGRDALDKLEAGANLVQVYTGFIYEGPAMVKRLNHYLTKYYLKKNSGA